MANKKVQAFKTPALRRFGLPLVTIAAFAAVGSYFLLRSHAATLSYTQFLTYTSAAQTAGVTTVVSQVESLGSQTVNQVAPGGKLTYLVGGKVAIKSECYYIQVLPLK